MKIGTAQSDRAIAEAIELNARLGRFGGSGPGSNGGENNGSGSEGSGLSGDASKVGDKTRILTGFLLLVVLMTFGGLLGAYVVVSTNRAIEWQPFDLPVQIWISTALILASSGTYELARRAVFRDDQEKIRRYLIATTVLGGVFISAQLMVWLALVERGFYMRGNPYAGFFYILTAAHAIHVLGGIVALGTTLLRCWYPAMSDREYVYRRNLARSVGWYWHFMAGLWVVLFVMLGFWK